ncbi:hypothetical protein RFI_33853, partial [Reticulomyxa filosa]
MIDKYHINPNLITCISLLSVCGNARDMKSAELIWDTIKNDSSIRIDEIAITSMLNMIEILDYSQRSEQFISINEISCTIIMLGFLRTNKIKEMFDFYDQQIPKLLLNNKINLKYNKLISLKS